jgi:hypothetical protein
MGRFSFALVVYNGLVTNAPTRLTRPRPLLILTYPTREREKMEDKKISRLELISWLEGWRHTAETEYELEGEASAFQFVIDTLKDDKWVLLQDN